MDDYISQDMMTQLTKEMSKLFSQYDFSFVECFKLLLSGDLKEAASYVTEGIKESTVLVFTECKEILITLLLIGIMGSIFQLLSDSFENKQVSKIAQSIFLFLAATLLLGLYQKGNDLCSGFLETEGEFMRIILPVFCITLTVINGSATGYSFYQMTLFVLFVMGQQSGNVYRSSRIFVTGNVISEVRCQ